MSQSQPDPATRATPPRVLCALLLCLAGLAFGSARAETERLLVPRSQLARQPVGAGERVLEDYGDMLLVESRSGARSGGAMASRIVRSRLSFADFPFDTERRAHLAGDPPARLLRPRSPDTSPALHVVAFHGPIKDAWLDELRTLGAELVEYLPENAYIVRVAPDRLAEIRALRSAGSSPVSWVGYFQPAYRIARSLIAAAGEQRVRVQFQNTTRGRLLAQIVARRSELLSPLREEGGFLTAIVRVPGEWLEAWAAAPGIYRIEPWVEPILAGEVGALNNAGQRVNGRVAGAGDDGLPYLDWLASRGFDTQSIWSFAVNITDTGLDKGNLPGSWHPDFYGPGGTTPRVAYAKDWTLDAGGGYDGVDGNGHGTNCAGVAGGFNDDEALGTSTVSPAGYRFGIGVAPNVRLGGSKIFDYNGSWGLVGSYSDIESFAYGEGARISSNSWGADVNEYTWDSRSYDELVRDADPQTPGNQEMVILFAAGNAGPQANTVGAPGNAKNVITLAAAENWWPENSSCGWSMSFQDSPGDDIVYYSGRGPTADGRTKPDLAAVAHGWITTRGSQAGTGCGDPYVGADTLLYRNFNGTSAATPAAAGSAALFFRHALDAWGEAPSPALVKAALVATARDLVGGTDAVTSAGSGPALSAVPNESQGWGLIDIGTLFDGVGTHHFDQDEIFGGSGQSWTISLGIDRVSRPVKIVLAWTDAPGSTVADAWMNDLDLEVTYGGNTYLGNVMSGGYSDVGGEADFRNNLEVVHLPAGSSGGLSVTVRATNVAADGVPGNLDPTDQDFALYVYNATDCAPLEAPSEIAATAVTEQSIALDWTAVEGAQGYRVYRSADQGSFSAVADVPAARTAFLDEQVPAGATYTYLVRSIGACESADSPFASATPHGACILPPSFAGLETVSDEEQGVCGLRLTWAEGQSGCGARVLYDVHRSVDPAFVPSSATLVASGVSGSSFLDSGAIDAGVEYVYLVRAVDTSTGVEDDNAVKLSAGASAGIAYRPSSTRVTIPRWNATPVTSSIVATETTPIIDLQAHVHIDHAASDELEVTLQSPAGTSVTLHDHTMAAAAGIETVYDRDTLASGPGSLDDLAGETLAGSWTLGVLHDQFGARGELVSWALEARLACESAAAGTGELSAAGQTRVTKGIGGVLQVHYGAAPFSDERRVYVGSRETPESPLQWDSVFCALHERLAEISPAQLAPGAVQLLLPAAAGAGVLGSLGQDSAGAERSGAGLPGCPIALARPARPVPVAASIQGDSLPARSRSAAPGREPGTRPRRSGGAAEAPPRPAEVRWRLERLAGARGEACP